MKSWKNPLRTTWYLSDSVQDSLRSIGARVRVRLNRANASKAHQFSRQGPKLPIWGSLLLIAGAAGSMGVGQCVECLDNDGDGYGDGVCLAPDCDDTDPNVNPFAQEVCADGLDNDCDGQIDAADLECNWDDMEPVPEGVFYRGTCNEKTTPPCVAGDPGFSTTWSEVETPFREIYVDAFYLDLFEVSVADFRVCAEVGACISQNYLTNQDYAICHYGKQGYDTHPMNCVGWYGAYEYCRFAGKRLPTEAEWEKAARGTEAYIFPWGNDKASCSKANYSYATNLFCEGTTAPVDSCPEGVSPYGAYNMAGNVWEWVADWYDPDYYDETYPLPDYSPDENPQGPESGEYKLIRGGSWVSSEAFIRTTMKHYYHTNTVTEDLGFRCAR